MSNKKERKKFRDTRFGGFLNKAGSKIISGGGDVLDIAATAATGNITGAVAKTATALSRNNDNESEALCDEMFKLKTEFQREMRKYEIEEINIHAADRDSARQRQIEISRSGRGDVLFYAVGFTILAAFVFCVIVVLFFNLQNANLAHLIIGEILGMVTGLVVYHFGSSRGSKDKDLLIENIKQPMR